jgi:TonB-linked SusC/RagA family outer membrane protein
MRFCSTKGMKLPFKMGYLALHPFLKRIFACSLFLFFFVSMALTQAKKVTGKVYESNTGQELPGVTVAIEGTSKATTTDNSGSYSIEVPSSNATLSFSYVGSVIQKIKVGNRSAIDVSLIADTRQLSQVVVTGYGSQRRKDLTGSISSISSAQIENVPVTTLDQALQGRSAGVNVLNNDGAPGGGVNIQIRGIGSFGNNDPLFVVDGYPIAGNLNTINPGDIASIDILKDASATAIYGNRAANGVVIVSTKRGNRNGVQLSLDALTSIQAEPKQYKLLNAFQWATLINRLAPVDNITLLPEWSNPAALHNIDWQEEIYQKGLKQNYNIALRGGNEKVQSAFSAGYFDQKGIVLGSNYKRINLSLNLDYNAYSWLKSSSSFKYSRVDSKIPFGTGSISSLNVLPPSITGNHLTDLAKDANGNYGFYNPVDPNTKLYTNPLYSIETTDQKNLNNFFLGTTSLEATIIPGLRIKTNLGINTNDYAGYYFTPSDKRAQEQYGLGTINALANYSQSANNNFEWLWENTISYTKTFGDHSIDVVGGVSDQKNVYRELSFRGQGSISDALRNVRSYDELDRSGFQQPYSLASQFGRINYKFKDKYLITGTVRRDGSSKFAKDHQYGTFPSGSIAWKVKEESFLKNVSVINDLKIRGSYGEVGNERGIFPFQYLSTYTTGGPEQSIGNVGYPFNKVYQPGLILSALPNPDLKWETAKIADIGLDAAFLNGRLTLTVDYYNKESHDFLLNIPVPAQTGFTTAARNVGSIRNRGIEVSVDYRKSKKDFSYGVNVNFSTIHNELLSLTEGQTALSNFQLNENGLFGLGGSGSWGEFSLSKIGGPVGEFYGYKSDGIFQTQKEVDDLNSIAESKHGAGSVYQGTTVAGDRKFVDVNGDGWVTPDDRVALGSPIPKILGSVNLDFTYKSFDFNAFFYGVSGNKIFNNNQSSLESFGQLSNISEKYLLNSWTPTNPSNRYPRVTANDYNQNRSGRPSSAFIEDGSYLRLRNVQLGYTLPSDLTRKVAISKARLYVSAQNLFTITNYSGLDPEIGLPQQGNGARNVYASGIDIGTYPTSRFYTFGLNVTF